MSRGAWAAAVMTVVGLGSVVGVLMSRATAPPDLHGHLLEPPLPAPAVEVELRSSEGPVRTEDLRGHHTVLFFGYTHCPDVCPMTLARIARAKELMTPEAAAELRVVMVSVDPERDTPEITDTYARRFDPSFRGLSGERAEIERLASAYGIFHGRARGPAGEADNYMVDHTATLLVLDPRGRVRMMLGHDLTAEQIASDLDWLLAG